MAVTDEKDGALATAAVAAAAGVAAYGLRKALTTGGGTAALVPGRNDEDDRDDDDDEGGDGGGLTRGSSLLSTVWDSAAGSLLPLAEEAADAAGKWTAENAPELVRDRIVPRFIESFKDAA
jgi:hypothetical protein